MADLFLSARFPLGVYYGHKQDGSIDRVPSPARLHAAFLNAAAQGRLSDNGQPSEQGLEALQWLEENPPVALFQPETFVTGGISTRFAYRADGRIDTKTKRPKVQQRRVSDGIAVGDFFGYKWTNAPDQVVQTIGVLCEDVACLGEAQSLVILELLEFEPNLELDPEGHAFKIGGIARDIPTQGRTQHLINAYNASFGRKEPSVSRDKFSGSEDHVSYKPPTQGTSVAWYKTANQNTPDADAPWIEAHFFELDRALPQKYWVELCTAMHRALVAQTGSNVSSFITGKYSSKNSARPANRLAIQYLPESVTTDFGLNGPAIVLFIPKGVTSEDLSQIQRARHISRLWSQRFGKVAIRYANISRKGDSFWKATPDGYVRTWVPLSPVIPETRRLKSDPQWSLNDSGLLSLGYVFRDTFDIHSSGEQKYIDYRDAVSAKGAKVRNAKVAVGRSADFVHRIHQSVPIQPYTAEFHLTNLASDTSAIMVGQSRHLGGGLLIPVDTPAGKDDN